MDKQTQKGFTLIELLIVIAIVAILSIVVILTLNPAELLKQARDSTRISDLNSIKSALSLFVADSKTTLAGSYSSCYITTSTAPGANCDSTFSGSYTSATSTGSQAVNGTGWLPVNFTSISSGSPISNLPLDPINNVTYYYAYGATSSNSTFKLVANMESVKYAATGPNDVEGTDGGRISTYFEVGSNVGL